MAKNILITILVIVTCTPVIILLIFAWHDVARLVFLDGEWGILLYLGWIIGVLLLGMIVGHKSK